jgi:hypothetical protein
MIRILLPQRSAVVDDVPFILARKEQSKRVRKVRDLFRNHHFTSRFARVYLSGRTGDGKTGTAQERKNHPALEVILLCMNQRINRSFSRPGLTRAAAG